MKPAKEYDNTKTSGESAYLDGTNKKNDEGGGDKSKTVEGGEERSHFTNKNVKIGCSPTKIWRFPKMGYPQIIHLFLRISTTNHVQVQHLKMLSEKVASSYGCSSQILAKKWWQKPQIC